MRVGRTSTGSRILSALLVVCMVLGMIPATVMPVFAADSATVNNVNTIRNYAANLLNSNFSIAASEDDDSKDDKFTWDTEGKTTNWRYYNGVMLDALLMLGVDSAAGNALEFAKDFLDTNTQNADKAVTHYIANEVDSVPPALVLFDLLDTAEVTDSDRAIYEKAINYVFKQLENQYSYADCGGNYLHKQNSFADDPTDSWSDYEIGLDGIYMAEPFLMEYANALAQGKITNTVNSKTASDIYKEVYDRLMWVADKMYDSNTGLYHHGWSVDNSKGNGHFWSRGIGWYAAGLVMCIDLMPAGQHKTDLIGNLGKLFDGMLQYQDDSGLWYNVVNRDSSLTANNGNKLEASGTALMAYAMMKAYNEGWVTASKYATAAEKGFNGIVSAMKDGKIVNIYKSSGVCTNDDDYCKNSYVPDEAKGVGPVLMAAAEVSKYAGVEEVFNTGVVVAPEMTVVKGATTINTAGIKATLVSNYGTVANGVASQLNYVLGDTSGSTATVTVYNGDVAIDTFTVKVADPNTPATGEGSLGIEGDEVTVPSNPSFSAGDWVSVSTGGSGSGDQYYRVSSITAGVEYVFTADTSSNSAGSSSVSNGSLSKITIDNNDTEKNDAGDTVYKLSGTIFCWNVDNQGRIFVNSGNETYYVQIKANSSSNVTLVTNADEASKFTFSGSGSGTSAKLTAQTTAANGKTAYFRVDSNGFNSSGSSGTFLAFTKVPSGEAVYAKLTGTQGFVYPFGVASGDIIADIKASTDFKILVSANSDGSGATEVAMSDSLVTVEKNSDYKNDQAKTNNFIVKYDGVQIGTIPVVVYDDSTSVTNYDVDLSVNPGAVVANVGDGTTQLNANVVINDLNGYGWYVSYSGGSDSVATVSESGLVTIKGAGSTTITATLTSITYGGKTYTSADFGTITANVPVVVNAEPVVQEITYSITGLTILPGSVEVGQGAQATATAAASDASGNHSYTFSYAITSGGNGASINSTTGAITTTAAGTYTVTATLAQVDGNGSFKAGTVTKTATFTVVEPASYDYTIKGANGNALAGQSITLNEGETYTPSFSVKLGDQDVTSGYAMTLTSESTAISINGTTITANKVSADTVATVTATVAPFNRASASGTSVTFNVTVKAAAEDEVAAPVTGQITTTITTTGSGSGNTYIFSTAGDTNTNTSNFYKFTDTSDKDESFTYNDVSYGTPLIKLEAADSKSDKITFTTVNAGTLTMYVQSSSSSNGGVRVTDANGNVIKEWTYKSGDGVQALTVDLAAKTAYTITAFAKEQWVGYISYAEQGTGSTTSTTVYNADLTASNIEMTVGQTGVSAAKPGIAVKKATDNSPATPTSYAVTYAVTGGDNCITIDPNTGAITANSAGTAHVTATLSAIDMGEGDDVINTPAEITFKVTVTAAPENYTYTYQLFTPDGIEVYDYSYITNNIEVGETWKPTLKVTRSDGEDVSDQFTVTLRSSNTQAATVNGDTATGVSVNTTTIDVYVSDANGNEVKSWVSKIGLNVTAAPVEYWVKAEGFASDYKSFPITEDIQTWTFTNESFGDSAWLNAIAQVVENANDEVAFATIRADNFAWFGNSHADRLTALETAGVPSDGNWTTWQQLAQDGVDGKITFQLVGDYAVVGISIGSVTGVYLMDVSEMESPELRITGEQCGLSNPNNITDPNSGEHINISKAVDRANLLNNLTISATEIWLEREQSGNTTVTLNSAVDSYEVTYSLASGTSAVFDGQNFTAKNLGTTVGTATLTSVTIDGTTYEIDGVSCSFNVKTIPWWVNEKTESVTVEAGQTITFTYSGDMPDVGRGAGYVDDVVLVKDNGDGTTTTIWSTNFDNGTEGWTFENGFGDIQGSMTYGDVARVYKSLRLYRSSGQAYQDLSASYSVTVDEPGTYYFTYNQLIEDATYGIGTMKGYISASEPEEPTPVGNEYVIADAMVNGKQYLFSNKINSERAAYWNGSDWATGTITRTAVDGKDNTYTIESTTGFTLFTWEATGTNTGYFYSIVNGSKVYLNDDGDLEATSTSDATEFTVDLSAGTVKGDNGKWLKVDSDALSYKTSEETSMLLYTPTSGGTTPDPDPDPDVPADTGFVLDTSGNVDMDDGEYIIVAKDGDKYYALQNGDSAPVEVTVTNGKVNISYADAANIIWIFDETHIYNIKGTPDSTSDDRYLRNDSAPSKGNSNDKNSTVTVVDASTGAYGINLEGSGRYLYYDGEKFTRAGSSDGVQTIYLYKWTDEVATPVSATVSPSTVNVPNSGTVDLSGVTMEVTMSDGTKKTIQNADLTYDISGINTAVAKEHTVPVSYTENGKTVTANVTVVVAAPSSGGTETSDRWKHNFSVDGETDADEFYSITGNFSTSYTGSYGELSFNKVLKMESSTKVSFTAPNEGTFTLVFDTEDSPTHSVYLTDPDGNKKSYTVPSNGVLTIDLPKGGEYLLEKKDGASYVFYMEYASAVTDGIEVTAPGILYIAGSAGWENAAPTHTLQYTVKHNDEDVTGSYTIVWSSLDDTVVRVDENGVITGLKSGTTSVTAKVTIDGEEYTDTVQVTVVGPGVSATEEMELIFGEPGKNTGNITSTVYAGGVTTNNYTLGYFSSNENVATVDPTTGVVTAQGPGQATIYTYVTHVNGYQIYSGTPSVDAIPNIYDTTKVTVTAKEVVDAHLNSYDYIFRTVNDPDDSTNLINVLTYKPSVGVDGDITAEAGLILTIEFNTGEKRTVHYGDGGLTVDWSNVDFSKEEIQTAVVIYKDPATGTELFRDTIWLHIEDFDYTKYDGIVTYEDGIHFVLDTDGINVNEEYAIVPGNADNVALKNPNPTATGSGSAGSTSVTLAHGVIESTTNPGTYLFNGAAVDYLTMAESDIQASSWLLDTFVNNVVCADGVTRTQMNASALLRYLGGGTSMTQLIHANVAHIYLETVSVVDGEYRIVLGFGLNNQPYYLGYENGVWTATTEASSVYLYNKHIEMIQDYGVDYDLDPTKMGIPEGFVADPIIPKISYNQGAYVSKDDYTIVWSSSDPTVATVDQNGVVTGIKPGNATISATLYDVHGMMVICTTHNVEYITKTVEVTVTDSNPTPVLDPDEMTIGVGTMPNFSKIAVMMTFPGTNGEYDYPVPFDQLNFKLADATGTADDGTKMDRFDNTVPGTYTVPVTYAGQEFTLTIHVVEDPYAGLEEADSIPGFPDAGSVRMNKTAKGVLDFTATGVTKIELNMAGVSTKNSVDVVLIVDVSNSMGWTTTWFNGMTEEEVNDATDSQKIPTGGAGTGTDKLALAMKTADQFANILLNVDGGDNTITFVTFAGADRDHGGSSDNVDSVRTPMVGIGDYDIASKVFGDTKFTTLDKDGTGAKYSLQIGGYSDDGYGEASVSGSNRGNTNYDYAFGEAIDAVNQLKEKYAANNNGERYEDSGRQIHVVFMTDGAPSHYNDQRGNGSAKDTLWDGSGDTYTTISDNSEAKWLEYIKSYNKLADELKSQIDGAYTVGFDMAHGGFGDYSYDLDEMQRVLEGLAKNTVVPVTMADDEEELNDYFTTLARALAYAGTNAQVTDVIGGNFSLFTGVSMYSEDIVDGEIMSQDTYNDMKEMSFPITVSSYRLVTASDVGKSMSVIMTDGSIQTVTVADQHLGLRVNEDPEILEQITFSADGAQAYSTLKSGNIMTDNSKGERVIDAQTFTYTATLDTMTVDGKTVEHAKDETIKWKIGTITDREIAMEYYAYLDGSLDNPREAVEAVYATNEYAYAEYVDVYGKYVKRYYGVPQIAWGKANVTVRFFLVNNQGQYVNRAGVTFTNPANRIFLDGRAQYEAELNNQVSFTALDALAQAGLAGSNVLYDVTAGATVTNANEGIAYPVSWVMNNGLNNIANLLTYTDTSGGYGSNVIIDIPVVMTSLGESDRPMANTTVVMDYGKPMDINVFSGGENDYKNGYPNHRPDDDSKLYWYEMEVAGFAAYSANHDLRDYVDQKNVISTTLGDEATYFTTANGKYVVTSKNGDTQIQFIPTTFLDDVEQVFVAVKFQEYNYDNGVKGSATDQYYIMYKQVNILPATVMYYETDGNMGGAFTYSSGGWTLETGTSKDPVQDEYVSGSDIYGADSSYAQDSGLSNNSSFKAAGQGVNNTTVSFTFTGTGFDIISRTGQQQGMIRVIVKNSRGEEVKRVTVTNKGTNELFQIPVVSVELGVYDTYSVEIGVYNQVTYPEGFESLSRGNQFYFDAVRIYGAMVDTETFVEGATMVNNEYTVNSATVGSIYASDGEYKPEITEVGQLLVDLETFTSIDTNVAENMGVLYMDAYTLSDEEGVNYVRSDAVADYKNYGANNEIYLGKGQGIAFVITSRGTNPATVQIGAKSITGGSVTLNAAIFDDLNNKTTLTKTITTSTAMFYELPGNMQALFADGSAYVVIWNTGEDVLSITDIKVAYDQEPASAVTFMFSRSLANYATTMMLRSMVEDAGETGSLKKDSTGEWYYTVGSVADSSYTGLVEHTNGTWYVVNGEVDFSYNGLMEQDGETYYIRGGCVDTSLNGLRKLDGIWMYFDQGHNDTAFAGLVAYNGMLVYAENGEVNFNKTGTASYDGEVYYVKYGIVSTGFSGLVKSDEGKWIYMTNGKFDTSYNGFAKYNENWWYVVNGEVALGYSGIASDGTNTFTVKYGQVIFADAE